MVAQTCLLIGLKKKKPLKNFIKTQNQKFFKKLDNIFILTSTKEKQTC